MPRLLLWTDTSLRRTDMYKYCLAFIYVFPTSKEICHRVCFKTVSQELPSSFSLFYFHELTEHYMWYIQSVHFLWSITAWCSLYRTVGSLYRTVGVSGLTYTVPFHSLHQAIKLTWLP